MNAPSQAEDILDILIFGGPWGVAGVANVRGQGITIHECR